jgi:hypothetical protein
MSIEQRRVSEKTPPAGPAMKDKQVLTGKQLKIDQEIGEHCLSFELLAINQDFYYKNS